MKITLLNGDTKDVKLSRFPAMAGWELQRRYVEFVLTKDAAFRQGFTLEILSYASVRIGESDQALSTSALVENHLQKWENIRDVFEGVLALNGIDPANHAEKEHYWSYAGAELAESFIANTTKLIGPLLELQMSKENKE